MNISNKRNEQLSSSAALPAPFRKILLPTDLTNESTNAFRHAVRIGMACQSNLEILHILGADEEQQTCFPSVRRQLIDWHHIQPDDLDTDICDSGLILSKRLSRGKLLPVVTHRVKKAKSDLLVLTSHNYRTRVNLFVCSKAEILSRRAAVSTLFVPAEGGGIVSPNTGQWNVKRVLVPVASKPRPDLALYLLCCFLKTLALPECEVGLLHVGKPAEFPSLRLSDVRGVKWSKICLQGLLVKRLLSLAKSWEPDLIVMPTSGQSAVGGSLFASRTERVLHEIDCPLLAIRVGQK